MIDAKAYLQQVRLYDTHINNSMDELARLKAMTLKVTSTLSGDVVSGSHNQDKLGDAVAKIIDLQAEINDQIDRYIDLKKQVNTVLDLIKDADQLQVLLYRYLGIYDHTKKEVYYPTLEEIAVKMCMTYRNVCYIHGKALQTVSGLLQDERKEEDRD